MRLLAVAILGSITFWIGGCSKNPQHVPIAGKVLIDGKPLTKGTIQFVPENGRPVASKILTDGSFRLREVSVTGRSPLIGIRPGKYRISVSASDVLDEDANKVHWYVPAHYADFRTSNLEMEVQGADEGLTIELTWEGAKEDEQLSNDEKDVENPSEENGQGNDQTDLNALEKDTPVKNEALSAKEMKDPNKTGAIQKE